MNEPKAVVSNLKNFTEWPILKQSKTFSKKANETGNTAIADD